VTERPVADVRSISAPCAGALRGPNWWSPAAAPAYWQETTCTDSGGEGGGSDGGADGGGGTDGGGSDSGGGTCPDFRQPYAGDTPYQVGDKVVFDGKVYVSTFGPNWGSPVAVPQYWSESEC
jgi:N-acetylglucosamine-binding protein A